MSRGVIRENREKIAGYEKKINNVRKRSFLELALRESGQRKTIRIEVGICGLEII